MKTSKSSLNQQTPLTPNEKKVLEFIKLFLVSNGFPPTYQEIKEEFGFASYFSVQRYLKQLETKGYVKSPWRNKKRALELLETDSPASSTQAPPNGIAAQAIPFLGKVAAGRPIEAIERDDQVHVPPSMLKKSHSAFALKVEGESMIEDGIRDGDILVIQKQATASNGQTVVALIDNEATVKRFYQRGPQVELRPANPTMKPIFVEAERVSIAGIVVGLLRDFK